MLDRLWERLGTLLAGRPRTLDDATAAANAEHIGWVVGTLRDGRYSVDAIDWRTEGDPSVYSFTADSLALAVLAAIASVLDARAAEAHP